MQKMDECFIISDKAAEDKERDSIDRRIFYLETFRSAVGKISLIVLITVLLERTYGTISHYLHYPTYFEVRYVSQFYAQMPALTMCPMNGYKSTVLKVKFISNATSI